jgi:outer membrane lipoprotein SlyB
VTRALLTSLIALPLITSCSTDPYKGHADVGTRVGVGVLAGTAAGGLAGAALGGHAITGAAAGMVVGGAVGAASTAFHQHHGRKYYRDTRGYCYYVDQSGHARYNYNISC